MNRAIPAAALLLLLAPLPPAGAQDASRNGPPAFVPLESPAATSQLRAARALAAEGKAAEAVEAYQAVADGPLGDRLAVCDTSRDTLEQARERAHREMSFLPGMARAYAARFEGTAGKLLAAALADADGRTLREVFRRFPLTAAGARAGLMLARAARRAGDGEECLGLLDRLLDLRPEGVPDAAPLADVLALRAAAAADAGDADLLEETVRAAAPLGPDAPVSGGGRLGERLAAARAALRPSGPVGPRGSLALLWQWMPADREEDDQGPGRPPSLVPIERPPPPPDHLVAVASGRVYWTDPWGVTALDLATGKPVGRSAPVSAAGGPPRDRRGETFAPAADGAGVVAALDLPEDSPGGRRLGTLDLFDPDLRLLARRGGEADLEHPEMARRFVFHGRPLLDGDRVYCAATEVVLPGEQAAGDVRTHVMAFHRAGLEPAWDTFVAYGSGIHTSTVAPAGSLAGRHGRLYLATQTGLEACLEERSGALLWAHRYRTPEMAPTPRLMPGPDGTMEPFLWYESPPVFSGDLVAFAPRDSYSIDFVFQRPLRESGEIRRTEYQRPRRDLEDMHALWVLGGPGGRFFLAGQTAPTARREAFPLVLRDLRTRDDAGNPLGDPIPWRGALMEPTVTGLPVRAADGVYAATEKSVCFLPYPGPDGAVERLVALAPQDPEHPRPSPGNLLVLPDRILSVHDDGILCFGPAPAGAQPPK